MEKLQKNLRRNSLIALTMLATSQTANAEDYLHPDVFYILPTNAPKVVSDYENGWYKKVETGNHPDCTDDFEIGNSGIFRDTIFDPNNFDTLDTYNGVIIDWEKLSFVKTDSYSVSPEIVPYPMGNAKEGYSVYDSSLMERISEIAFTVTPEQIDTLRKMGLAFDSEVRPYGSYNGITYGTPRTNSQSGLPVDTFQVMVDSDRLYRVQIRPDGDFMGVYAEDRTVPNAFAAMRYDFKRNETDVVASDVLSNNDERMPFREVYEHIDTGERIEIKRIGSCDPKDTNPAYERLTSWFDKIRPVDYGRRVNRDIDSN